jgi:hypothetical protein
LQNLEVIAKLNAAQSTAQYGITVMADLTHEEYVQQVY